MASDFAELSVAFPWFFPTLACVLGACVGSFLNVVIYRLPREQSVVFPGSHCACGQPIKWHDNIPVISWLVLRGRARCCGRAFSFRYPFVELLTAGLFLACWLHFPPAVAVCGWVFLSCLVAATFIDLDHMIIPDVFTIGLGVLGVLLSFAVPALHGFASGDFWTDAAGGGRASLIGLLVGSAVVLWISVLAEAVLHKAAMGFGDVKFVGAIGAFCGWQGALFAVFGGAVIGTVWFAIALAWQRTTGRASPVAPPVEAPTEEDLAPAFGWLDAAALGSAVIGVVVSFFVPALHGQDSGVFALDALRALLLATSGLLLGSGAMLWLCLLVERVARREFIPFALVQFAGTVGALAWPLTWLGVSRGVGLAVAAGALGWAIWALSRRLRPRQHAEPADGTATNESAADVPPALGLGMHVPFGPMLAIAGGLYFLFFREAVLHALADLAEVF